MKTKKWRIPTKKDVEDVLKLCGPFRRTGARGQSVEKATQIWMREMLEIKGGATAITSTIMSVWVAMTAGKPPTE